MNIYDISQKAGVSIATVSRVLNGSDKVSDKTRKKVLAVMEENSYTPNAFARSLGLNSMHTSRDSLLRLLGCLSGAGHLLSGAGAAQKLLCIHALLYRIPTAGKAELFTPAFVP